MRLEKFVREVFLPEIRIRKRSWPLDEGILRRHILPFFGKKPLSAIRGAEVEAWRRGLINNGLSPSSVNRVLSVLRSILRHARENGHAAPGPAIRSLPVARRITRFLSEAEAALLWTELQKQEHKAALALRLILLTGCRKNEILKARWEHVDLEKSLLMVPLAKSGQPRYVPLCNEAKKILAKLRISTDSAWLFPGRSKDRPITDIYYFWNQLRQKLGLRGARIHDLRHTFASLLLASGHSLYEAQTILGHADSRSTAIYAHLSNGELARACGDVAQRLKGLPALKEENAQGNDARCMERLLENLLDHALADVKQKMLEELLRLREKFDANYNDDELQYF